MHLVALVEAEDHVCCRYRLAALRPHLAAAGHTLELRRVPRSWLGRLAPDRSLARADAVILQRKLLPPLAVALLRRRVRRLVFDFDDALWLRDSFSPKGFEDPRRARRFAAVVRAADLVVAGNEYLAAEARRWTRDDRVVTIPTCVDVTKYPLPESRRGSRFSPSPLEGEGGERRSREPGEGNQSHTSPHPARSAAPRDPPSPSRGEGEDTRRALPGLQLVWVGSSSTLRGLERFAPSLSAIGKAAPGTRLKLICDRFIEVPGLPIDRCPWDAATEPAEIAAADVGIGWVPDDPWSRGKCGLKVLQYQAAGLPVVANPVGVQADFVRDGETGFRATTTEEWVAAVRRLAQDPGLRHRLGAAGRHQAEECYSVEAGAARWVAALGRLAELRKAG